MSDETNEVRNEVPTEASEATEANTDFIDDVFGDEGVPPADDSADNSLEQPVAPANNNSKTSERKAINVLATEFTLDIYRFASVVRSQGHATLADMLFRECMVINLAANTASNAIGRGRFLKCLEDGFYASGNVMEYLKFLSLCGAGNGKNSELFEQAETIHKIYAVSIKTATGKNKKTQPLYM